MSPLENARKRLIELKKEVEKIEGFIEMYERFSDEPGDPVVASFGPTEAALTGNSPVDNGDNKGVDKSEAPRRRRRSAGVPTANLVAMVERLLTEVGHPMTRGEILAALEFRDVMIPAEDKPRYIGTIMWRNKAKFVNIEGRGYWLRGEHPSGGAIGMGMLAGDPAEEHSDELPDIFS